MELVEEPGVTRQVLLEHRPEGLVADPSARDPVAVKHPSRIGVDHEDRAPGAIEQNRVSSLGTDARHIEHVSAEVAKRGSNQAFHATSMAGQEERDERAKPPGLDPVRACRADEAAKFARREGCEARWIQTTRCPEVLDGLRHSGPGGMLSQDRADGDLEAAAGRPPALGAEAVEHGRVEAQQAPFITIARGLH